MTCASETPEAPIFKIYEERMQAVKVAWLGCGNSVGFEVFEFDRRSSTIGPVSSILR
jgi:hypothetical protein